MKRNLILALMLLLVASFASAQHLKPIKMKNRLTDQEVTVEPLKNATYDCFEIYDSLNDEKIDIDGIFYSYTTPETTILVFEYYEKRKPKTFSYAIADPWSIKNLNGENTFIVQDEYAMSLIQPNLPGFVTVGVMDKKKGNQYHFVIKTKPREEYTSDEMMGMIIDKL